MTEKRKLAAVMFTDIIGYTTLMSKDEKAALKILENNRTLQQSLSKKHNGEFLKEMGDGTLLCFQSALDAVRCAMEIQEAVKDDPDLNLRIGIHLGDIVFKGGDVFGDGVNVASRIEKLAEAGGVCFSAEVYNSIRNQPGLQWVFLGEQRLKHVGRPVAVYALLGDEVRSAHPSGDHSIDDTGKNSIAVLPFVNISDDPEQEYFCDGMTEEIINGLTHIRDLKVIARTSAFMFKGKNEDMREIGRKLAVNHLLEGSVRKAGRKLRITAQLITVDDGSHLWSEKYDRDMEEVFAIQDEIALAIVDALEVTLLKKEKQALLTHSTTNQKAYNLYLQGRFYWNRMTLNNLENAVTCFNKAIETDPDFALAYFGLADTYWVLHQMVPLPAREAMPRAKEAAMKALELDSTLAEAWALAGMILYAYEWKWDEAETYFKKAYSINPASGPVKMYYSSYLQLTDRKEEAVRMMEETLETDPYSLVFGHNVAIRLYVSRRYEEAIKKDEALLSMEPNFSMPYGLIGRTYICMGYYDKAEEALIKANELTGGRTEALPNLGYVYAIQGKKQEAENILNRLHKESQERYVPAFFYTYVYNGLGDTVRTFEYLQKAIQERDPLVAWWITDELFSNLRNDRRYADIIRTVGQESLEPELMKKFPAEPSKPSIIVLPFVNISPDPDQEYFSDGLTEEIITDLSHIHDLLVISRSSAMTFKGTRKKISDIAGEVKVRYVLEGSVRKAGNNLRITAQLIDAQTDAHLWAEKYSGTLDDVFDIQEKVSTLIAEALKIKLSPAETSLLHQRPIENVYAYDCYLQARRYTMAFTREGLEKALHLLEKAAGLTGPNAAIDAGTAFAHFQYANMGIDQADHIQEADRLIEKALKLDPESTDAHFALGCMNMIFHANVFQGLKHFKQAYQHRSGDTELMQWMSWLYALIGKTDEAMVLADRCMEIDPLNSGSRTLKALIYFMQGRFGEAEEPVLNCQQANPESNMWNLWAALLFAYTGRSEEAFELVETHVGEADQDGLGKLCLALKYALRGDAEGLSGLLDDDFKKTVHMDCQYSWHMAAFYSFLGEKKEALTWLENAVERGFINYPFLEHHDRLLDNVRKESRFTTLMKRVKKEWESFEV